MDLNKKLSLYLIDKDKKKKKDKRGLAKNEFYASQAGYCPKMVYLSKTGSVASHPPSTLKIFLLGNLVEDFLVNSIFPEAAETQETAYIDDGEIYIRGRLDVRVDDTIYEIKSTKSIPSSPYLHHLMQLNIYLNALNLQKGVVLYIEKNTGRIKEFPLEFDQEIFDEAMSGFKMVYDAIKNDYEPPGVKSWLCKSCIYADDCRLSNCGKRK